EPLNRARAQEATDESRGGTRDDVKVERHVRPECDRGRKRGRVEQCGAAVNSPWSCDAPYRKPALAVEGVGAGRLERNHPSLKPAQSNREAMGHSLDPAVRGREVWRQDEQLWPPRPPLAGLGVRRAPRDA